jgi:hypothetical protein
MAVQLTTRENAFVESFNGTFRSECLNTHWFLDLKEARQLIEEWKTFILSRLVGIDSHSKRPSTRLRKDFSQDH